MAITRAAKRASARSVGCAAGLAARNSSTRSATPVVFRRSLAAWLAAIASAGSPLAHAETWHVVPAFSLESTLTNNVDLSSGDQRRSDWINQLTPSIRFDETGARTKLTGSVAASILLYARTSQNNYVAPQVSINGTVEAIERFLFVDASANVSQQYLSPFGARPGNLANATQNRYAAQTYSVSPYIKGNARDNIDYELRQINTWSNATGVSAGTAGNGSYTDEIVGHVTGNSRPAGWSVDYDRNEIRFTDQSKETTEIGRMRAVYSPDTTLRLSAIGGYEDNRFFQTTDKGATYGVGAEWRPDDRNSLSATWEHRFFGASYHASFDHRAPLTVWSIKASRDITSYPQQLGSLPEGANVNSLLNALFSSRVQDPVERQTLVDQVIRNRGLPLVLSGPVALFAQQLTLVESATATFGILGARNSVFFSAYRARNEPIETAQAEDIALLQAQLTNNTQVGTNVIWTHQLGSGFLFNTSADWSRTRENVTPFGTTRQFAVRALVSRAMSVLTSVYTGLRYQDSRSNVNTSYNEVAVFVGLTHTFH